MAAVLPDLSGADLECVELGLVCARATVQCEVMRIELRMTVV